MATKYNISSVDTDAIYVRRDLFSDKGLWMWGSDTYGALGDGVATPDKSSPVQTLASGTSWKQLACGSQQSGAIRNDGTLWMWGYNGNGVLGDNTTANKSSPVQTITGGTNWKSLSIGYTHTGAIKTDGTLWMWGRGFLGQIGNNTNGATNSSPVQTICGGTNWKQVSCNGPANGGMTAAIKTDGTLWTWGNNSFGQLGDNSKTHRSSPVQTITGGTTWKSVSTGQNHTAAIKIDGTLWMWGSNVQFQLGDNTATHRSSPIQTITGDTNWKQVSCGDSHTAAIKTNGTLWVWGYNSNGQLGNNTADAAIRASSPIQTVAGGNNWKSVSAGYFFTAAIKTDGTLWTWGDNTEGQLGNNSRSMVSSPVQTVAGGTTWKQVSAGGYTGRRSMGALKE